ncbi:putative ORAOV1 family protein [Colletotrichum sp. SAR 10_86]|nr:putative ORAOV1 family protein [Colletotrichum sp. SAR 10_86]KAI8252371.1 putative ORAOV1 family protein [Colletotrichum sp. SAR 10_77]
MDDPFDDVLNLEEQFFTEGFRQGTADGILAGKIEGRSVGLAKGYEKFLESGRIHGRSVVWANRLSLPQKTAAVPRASSSEQQQKQPTESKTCSLPPLAPNARLEKNVIAAFALVEPETLSKENNDDAVNDFDDRFKRAQGKVKIIERMTGEGAAAKEAAVEAPKVAEPNGA